MINAKSIEEQIGGARKIGLLTFSSNHKIYNYVKDEFQSLCSISIRGRSHIT